MLISMILSCYYLFHFFDKNLQIVHINMDSMLNLDLELTFICAYIYTRLYLKYKCNFPFFIRQHYYNNTISMPSKHNTMAFVLLYLLKLKHEKCWKVPGNSVIRICTALSDKIIHTIRYSVLFILLVLC